MRLLWITFALLIIISCSTKRNVKEVAVSDCIARWHYTDLDKELKVRVIHHYSTKGVFLCFCQPYSLLLAEVEGDTVAFLDYNFQRSLYPTQIVSVKPSKGQETSLDNCYAIFDNEQHDLLCSIDTAYYCRIVEN